MFVCIMILISIYHMVKNDEGIVLKNKAMDDLRIKKKKEKMRRIHAKKMVKSIEDAQGNDHEASLPDPNKE